MSGSPLIALPPEPASPPGSVLAGDGWWPDIDCNAARDALRLGEIVTQPRLIAALEGAVLTVTGDLAWWQAMLMAGTYDAVTNPAGTTPAMSLVTVTADQLAALREPHDEHGLNPWAGSDARRELSQPLRLYTGAQTIQLTGQLGGVQRLVALYLRAVRSAAAAELLQLYRDMGATTHADIRAEMLTSTSADYERMVIQAVRDMTGQTRVTSELI